MVRAPSGRTWRCPSVSIKAAPTPSQEVPLIKPRARTLVSVGMDGETGPGLVKDRLGPRELVADLSAPADLCYMGAPL
ncbi:hypothetical protein FRZ61_14530 [Hypericibacter adhaerens]|uniref:Uncharacterized protein n=1 Tax=Hypericibacter adhaerens TaxID=2602016 RepID=A0A5J6MWJ2_9PROT|nr:hypothetical protein FRZ61_14530 [Hypericibacter adhaerens]